MQINHHKKCRCAGRVHIANQPSIWNIAHDVFDGSKRQGSVGLVVHHQENAGDNLNHQYQQGQSTKEVEKVEIFGGVVLA